ncbi:zinc-ribbon domain-containing protein [Croceicoccus sp. F390]|uniref:Zinc-ribbon domain-containing protein n=1 Tax=Croceicoccus esteveae TaxID=3075597 RepID=A0ABU2ZGG8_9SPHN|nr:zinc-ribbon domain-containing protein [Croceicoccus sp. F390]MDT0575316.1 zinc-ribbon domain-containing protein [Croceicoccus sp. F390]
MIITCPSCDARYNVPDDAINAKGRSVRCAKCDTRWFVTAPEPEHDIAAAPDALSIDSHSPTVPPQHGDDAVTHPDATPLHEAATLTSNDAEQIPTSVSRSAPVSDEPTGEAAAVAASTASPSEPAREQRLRSPIRVDADDPYATLSERNDEVAKRQPVRWRMWIIALLMVLAFGAVLLAFAREGSLPGWLPAQAERAQDISPDLALDFPASEQRLQSGPDGKNFFTANGTILNKGQREHTIPPLQVVLRDREEQIVLSWEITPAQRVLAPDETLVVREAMTQIPASAQVAEIGWKAD